MTAAASRQVLVVEGNPDGHRLYYASLLATAATAAGDTVTIGTTREAASSPEWSIHMEAVSPPAKVVFIDDYSLVSISALASNLKADHVVVPDGDSFVYELSRGKRWSAPGTVSALIMREKGQQSAVPGLTKLTTLVKAGLFFVASMHRGVEVRVLKSAPWRGFSMLPISRDPVTMTWHAVKDRQLLVPKGGFWFGVVGNVGHRKNLPLVAAAVASLNRSDLGLIVAGQVDSGVLELAEPHLQRIRRNGGSVEIVDRLLGESEIDQVVAEVDCVVLAHSNDGPSGILGKAVAAGTRIVAAGAATLRTDCRHIGSSAHWVALTEQALADALALATTKPRPLPRLVASPEDFTAELLGLTR